MAKAKPAKQGKGTFAGMRHGPMMRGPVRGSIPAGSNVRMPMPAMMATMAMNKRKPK